MSESQSPPLKPKVFIKTFGCQMNEYDSTKMVDVLGVERGYERTLDLDDADLVLLNTCSVREKASEKVFSDLGRLKAWKSARPGRLVGVGGCVASQEGDAIARRAPVVDLVFGPQTLHRLPTLLDQARATGRPAVDIRFPEIEKFDRLPEPRADGPTAFVSIMEGCSKYCTFCIVPYTRGEEISRPLDDVLAEVDALVAQGVRELTLLGQNVNAYAGRMADGSTCDLALLLHILARFDGLKRLRYTTSHPAHFGDALIAAYARIDKLDNQLHLPVQSGSDRILAMMKRGYTQADYLAKIAKLRAVRPDLSLSTDLIVGFPSESDADFEATMQLIDAARFDAAFSFAYSPRPGTPAANLRDSVPAALKQARLDRVQARIRELGDAYADGLVGSVQRVLVTGPSRKGGGQLTAKTACNRSINFEGPLRLVGEEIAVRVTERRTNSLLGEIVVEALAS